MDKAAHHQSLQGNFYFLKACNGMFYYGLEVCEQVGVTKVFVRRSMNIDLARIGSVNIVKISKWEFLKIYFVWCLRRTAVFTPTPHPLPFVSRQAIVIHDGYPFQGRIGGLKRALFRIGLNLSRTQIVTISRSAATSFGLTNRKHYIRLPNKVTSERLSTNQECKLTSKAPSPLIIGLTGTDSPKKNYHRLFELLQDNHKEFSVLIYGDRNYYAENILKSFPNMLISIIEPSHAPIDSFSSAIGVLVVANSSEGFGRVIPNCLLGGVPVLAIRSEIYDEFFPGLINQYPSVRSLADQLHAIALNPSLAKSPDRYQALDSCNRLVLDFLDGAYRLKGFYHDH